MNQAAATTGVSVSVPGEKARAAQLAAEYERACAMSTDRLFVRIMLLQWAAAIAAAIWFSPLAWAGAASSVHLHVWAAVFLGGIITLFPVALAHFCPGERSTRHVVALGQMLMSGLLIHLSGGRIETHFHVFGSLALLAFYRDWRVLLTASLVVVLHHFGWGALWPQSVYGVASAGPWRWLEHAGWVVFEDVFLMLAILQGRREMLTLAERQVELEAAKEETERLVHVRTHELKMSEQRFRSLAGSAPIGIFQTDSLGNCTYVNEHWCALCGIGPDEASGLGWSAAIHPEDRVWVQIEWLRAAQQGEDWTRDFRVRRPGGETRWVRCHASGLRRSDAGYVGTLEDITAPKEFEAALQSAHDAALEANRAKSEFLATMSHEIRTPLNAIIGSADLLWETTLTEEQAEYVGMFRRAGGTLLAVINDILDLSKIESGHLELDPIPFELAELVEQTAQFMANRAHEKGIELLCSLDAELPTHVVGDPTRIRQVLLNLVGNAIKFTSRGEIALTVQRDPNGPTGNELLFSVRDTGIGIPADKLASIFDSFTQADSSTTRKFGGTGLGLTISKRLVELMGGRLRVESNPGKGSTFTFNLPLDPAEGAPSSTSAPVDLHGVRALVVDDNETNCRILEEFLSGWGMLVRTVESGAAAIAALEGATTAGTPYHLILLDCRMPEMDGFEVAATLGRSVAVAQATIMMLTSDARGGDIARARALGLGSYLVKPVRRVELYHAIVTMLGRTTAAPAAPLPGPVTLDHSDLRPLRILLVEDSEDNQRLIRSYLKHHPFRVDTANNGQEALQRYQEAKYDLVLMDVQMPVMDGYTATRAIRAWERVSGRAETPILALTANALQEDIGKSADAGCTTHLTKPIRKAALLDAISAYGRLAAAERVE